MKNTTKNIALATIIGASSVLSSQATAESVQDQIVKQFESGRVKVEYNFQEDSANQVRTTLGIAPKGSYEGLPIAVKGQLLESFRLNNFNNFQTDANYVALGSSINLNLGKVLTKTIAFGSFGDKESIGLEEQVQMGKVKSSFSLEHNPMTDSDRIGGQLALNATKNLLLTAGYDVQNTPKGDVTQTFVKAQYDLNANDTLAFAFAQRDKPDRQESIGAGFWTHSGQGVTFGSRLYGEFKSDDLGNQSFSGHYLFVPNAKAITGKAGATLLLDRQASGGINNFSMNVADLSISELSPIHPMYRTPKGLAFMVAGNISETKSTQSSRLAGTIAYTVPIKDNRLSLQFETANVHSSVTGDTQNYTPRMEFQKDNFYFGAAATFDHKTDAKLFFEAGYSF